MSGAIQSARPQAVFVVHDEAQHVTANRYEQILARGLRDPGRASVLTFKLTRSEIRRTK